MNFAERTKETFDISAQSFNFILGTERKSHGVRSGEHLRE